MLYQVYADVGGRVNVRIDVAEFILEDGSRLLMRASGIGPLGYIFAEDSGEQDLEVLLESGREYILG
jgi:hypothetical protein